MATLRFVNVSEEEIDLMKENSKNMPQSLE